MRKILNELGSIYNVGYILYGEAELIYKNSFYIKMLHYFIEVFVRFSIFIRSKFFYSFFRRLKLECSLNSRVLDGLLTTNENKI